jgi:hypothetical protein
MSDKKPQLTKYEIEVLIRHTLQDLSYGVGGSYVADDGESMDKREAAAARRAVETLKGMLEQMRAGKR